MNPNGIKSISPPRFRRYLFELNPGIAGGLVLSGINQLRFLRQMTGARCAHDRLATTELLGD